MGIKRIVDTSFWTDGKVDEFSPEDKYFMLYLLTNPFSTQLGIYEISIKQVAFQLGYSMDAVKVLIDRFETKYGMIFFSPSTNEIAIKNFLRHSIIKGGAPVRDCLIKEIKKVKNKELVARVFLHIKDSENLNETVQKIITEYEEKNGSLSYTNQKHNDIDIVNDNDIDNENDNEVSCPVSSNDTSNDTSNDKPSKKVIKYKFGEFKNVRLTENEFENLANSFGIELRDQAIKYLDEYIEEKDYKSKSHNLAIRRWVIEAVKEKSSRNQQSKNSSFDTDEFFNAAVKRSMNLTPREALEREAAERMGKNDSVTVSDDPELKRRADALREQLGG